MLCQSMQSLTYGGIALFLPLIRSDVGLNFTQAGTLAAGQSLTYAAMQLPAGYIADRLGPKWIFVTGLAGCNVLALALSQLHDFRLMVLNQALTGVCRALVFAPGLLLITSLFPPARRATAMGLYVAGGFSSNIVLNLLGPLLVRPFGWRLLFVTFAAGGLIMLTLYSRFGRPGPQPALESWPGIRKVARLLLNRGMALVAGIQYVRLAMASGLAFWLPTLIVVEKHQPLVVAGLAVAMSAALTAPSNFLGGYLSDRLRNPLIIIGISMIPLAITTFSLARVQGLVALLVVIAVNAVFVQLYFGPLFGLGIELAGARSVGLTSGFGNLFANLGGLTFGYLLGALKDATGSFDAGLYVLTAMCLAGLLFTLLLVPLRRRRVRLGSSPA
jgi:sugar phosphate permease